MKRVLIISPYFPPSNAADMQRVRMSLPYFKEFGWEAEVVTVAPEYSDMVKDELLLQSLPSSIKIHTVKAFPQKLTSKFGLGSLALRSLWFYKMKVSQLLKQGKFDLVYFSTTQFPVSILGRYWKKKLGVPYVIDMQDPWHSDYYKDKPKSQQPKKYWFSYRLNKYLEPIAMKAVDGLISVSEQYITDLQNRYPNLKNILAATITFGAFEPDNDIALNNAHRFPALLDKQTKNMVYIGRGGADMHKAIKPVFKALAWFVKNNPEVKLKLYFIGTCYAASGSGTATIMPLAVEHGVENYVVEITDRISYYHTLITLQQADALFMPGSDDPKYTASKIYPYLFTGKPLLTIFNSQSPAMKVFELCKAEYAYSYDNTPLLEEKILAFVGLLVNNALERPDYDKNALQQYTALQMTEKQCKLFDKVI
ncbi:glycosyltransferase [Mucilaginibacter auburnensis]|uniref:Glycosyl transferase family 4 n=1 Tax=Mucilaginibacter auburnensis TaxID=1457233 RepID=A0A2H9VM93_9SPHI|nr:glycosyltransferase [Mucilaginibacter auburnensis]PJJ79461.1 glycosyl transferase family 4 [Mucilaginibacter auburnensis]